METRMPKAHRSDSLDIAQRKIHALAIKRAKRPADVFAQGLEDTRAGDISEGGPKAIGTKTERTEVAEAMNNLTLVEMDALSKSFNDKGQFLRDEELERPAIQRRDRVQAIYYSRVLISAFEEAATYDPRRHHNEKEPPLWIDDDRYLAVLRELIDELKRLNALLEAEHQPTSQAVTASASSIATHFNTFLANYLAALGKGAAGLTVAAAAGLLYSSGLGKDIIDALWGHLKISH